MSCTAEEDDCRSIVGCLGLLLDMMDMVIEATRKILVLSMEI